MVGSLQRQAVIGERGQLLTAHQFGVLIRAIVECATDIGLTIYWRLIRFDRAGNKGLTAYASKRYASIGWSGVDASSKVLRVTRPPGLEAISNWITSDQARSYPAPIMATRIVIGAVPGAVGGKMSTFEECSL